MSRKPVVRQQVYDFICTYKKENDGLAPTYQTINDHFGWRSTMNAWFHVAGLVRDGLIRLDADRRIVIIDGQYIPPNE